QGAGPVGGVPQQPAGHHGAAEGERPGEVRERRGDRCAVAGGGTGVEEDEDLAPGRLGREDRQPGEQREPAEQQQDHGGAGTRGGGGGHEAITSPSQSAAMPTPMLSSR